MFLNADDTLIHCDVLSILAVHSHRTRYVQEKVKTEDRREKREDKLRERELSTIPLIMSFFYISNITISYIISKTIY